MTGKELLRIVENFKEFQNTLLGHKIEVFTDHNNLTYETIESASQRVQSWKSLIQEFGVALLYIKGEANIVADVFKWIPITYYAHKLADKTLEEDTCELLCLNSWFISDNTDCFSVNIEEISFLLDDHIVKAEHKLELQTESSTNIRTNLNKASFDWNYKPFEGINLVIAVIGFICPKLFENVF